MVLGICDGFISVSLVYVIAFTCLFGEFDILIVYGT